VHRLVCSGYAKPGQTGWALIGSFSLDVIIDLAYGMLVENLNPAEREELDKSLEIHEEQVEEREAEKKIVEVKRKSDGNVIQISEARLAQIRRNQGGVRKMNPMKET
jgi:hypothetical protein